MERCLKTVVLRLLPAAFLCMNVSAQERAGEAQIGFQHYYLTDGSRSLANAMGLTVNVREFLPRVGMLSVNLAPAANRGRFQTGTSFAELKQLPLLRQYWTVRGGDFRISGRLLQTPFNNLYFPDIVGRGGLIEAAHGTRAVGVFYGLESLQAGVRLPLRFIAPQTMAGAYYRQTFTDRFEIGARVVDLSNNLTKLRSTPQITMPLNPMEHARTGSIGALYTVVGKLKWYGEGTLSSSVQPGGIRNGTAFSASTGPMLDTKRLTFRANFVRQADSYLPLLGYSLGDRQGLFGELRLRPLSRLEVYGSGSEYHSNLRRDPQRPTYRSASHTGGVSLQLPARFTVSGQASQIDLSTRRSDEAAWVGSRNRQMQVTLSRPLAGHSLRASVRQFWQTYAAGSQIQRTLEVADNFQWGPLSLGAQVRGQKGSGVESRTSVFVQGNAQLSMKQFFVYANVQTGNDLANRTLFATSTMNSIVLGGAFQARNWDFSVDAYRNRLVTELNPESIFVLQGQGVYVPAVLAALNQWSVYFRMSKRLEWGKVGGLNLMNLDTYAAQKNVLYGSIEGFVYGEDHRGAEGIPISVDGGPAVFTDKTGRFRIENVGEGIHKVEIAMNELPADFDPGMITNLTLLVRPGVVSRADFDVLAVGYVIRGTVEAPADVRRGRVVRLLPGDRYTTTDKDGEFTFYNVPRGSYDVELAAESLPQFAVIRGVGKVAAQSGPEEHPAIRFEFEIQEPPKPVKQIALPQAAEVPAPSVTPSREAAPLDMPRPLSDPAPKRTAKPDSRDVVTLYQKGRALNDAQKFEEAVAVFTQAIEINPADALLFNARGFAYLRLNQYQAASDDFSEAIRLKPNYANALHNRAVARKKLGDLRGAQQDEQKSFQATALR